MAATKKARGKEAALNESDIVAATGIEDIVVPGHKPENDKGER